MNSQTGGKVNTNGTLAFLLSQLKPRGKWLTPFNVISIPVVLLGAVLLVIRYTRGLGSITNLSQDFPWGLWIGFDVVTAVAFAGGAYVLTFMVYILRLKKYYCLIRVTVLNGLLAYVFYAAALLIDMGRPWNIINPIIGNSFGVSSVLFLVAWKFLLYMVAILLEFSPVIAEWLGLQRVRKALARMMLAAVVFGVTLSTLHQSALGALFLMAREKIHPLWYSELIPILFFVSSIFAGISLVLFEGSINHRVFAGLMSPEDRKSHDTLAFDLARICAGAMFVYLFLQALVFIREGRISYAGTPMYYWYLTELLGFVLVPCALFVWAMRRKSLPLVRIAAVMTLIGIILNRLNVSIIAFRWDAPVRYYPTWMEVEVTLALIFTEIWVFRWIVNRMPILTRPPSWAVEQDESLHEKPHAATGKETISWKPQA